MDPGNVGKGAPSSPSSNLPEKSDTELKVIEFTGEDAMEKAHEQAQELMLKDWPGCITVAARVRQLCSFKNRHLML